MSNDAEFNERMKELKRRISDQFYAATKQGRLFEGISTGFIVFDEASDFTDGLVIDVQAELVEDDPEVPLLGAGDVD